MEQINLKNQILTYLYDFIEKPSVSDSDAEHLGADWLQETLKKQPYFQVHPEDCGSYEIPGDYRKRHIVYGLVKGDNIRKVVERNYLTKAVYVGDIQGDYDASMQAGVEFIHAGYGFGTVDANVPEITAFEELPKVVELVL